MLDLVKENQDPKQAQAKRADENLTVDTYTEEEYQKTLAYNDGLKNLNPKYANLKPLQGVIVRCYLFVPRFEQGMYIPMGVTVNVPTANGMAKAMSVEHKYPYSAKAVVVAVPSHITSLKAGDVVQLNPKVVQPVAFGDPKTGYKSYQENQFKLVGDQPSDVPTDLTHEDYGYLLVPYHQIECHVE